MDAPYENLITPYTELHAESCALLVVDAQNDWGDVGGVRPMPDLDRVIPGLVEVVEAFRRAERPNPLSRTPDRLGPADDQGDALGSADPALDQRHQLADRLGRYHPRTGVDGEPGEAVAGAQHALHDRQEALEIRLLVDGEVEVAVGDRAQRRGE